MIDSNLILLKVFFCNMKVLDLTVFLVLIPHVSSVKVILLRLYWFQLISSHAPSEIQILLPELLEMTKGYEVFVCNVCVSSIRV